MYISNFIKFIVLLVILGEVNSAFSQAPLSDGQPNQVKSQAQEEGIVDTGTEINVKNADIAAIIRIFSSRTKRNYILDERVKGKVSIYLPGKVTSEEAIQILDAALALKGFTSVPIGENLWKIIPSGEAKLTTIPTVNEIEGRGSALMVTKLINLKHVSAADISEIVGGLINTGVGLVKAYTGTNSLVIIDSEENIQRVTQIIDSLDVPQTDQEMTIIPIEYAEATDIADKITQILTDEKAEGGGTAAVSTDSVRARLKQANNQALGGAETGLNQVGATTISARSSSKPPKIIADERTNSLIVVADEDATARIRALASELDSPVNRSGNRFYVYRCQHASAEDLAEVLSGLVGGNVNTAGGGSSSSTSSSSSGSRASNSESSSGLGSRNSRSQNRLNSQSRTPGESRTENKATTVGATSVQFAEDFSITADASTNSLVVSANKSDYEKLLELLKQIDIKRRQVLVEAMILEVSVDDSVKTDTEFLTSLGGKDGGVLAVNNLGGLPTLLSDPTKLSQLSVAAASSGTLTLPGGISIPTQTVLLTAASNNTNVNVLSSPTILATDNEEAEIVVGENVPFLASTSSTTENLNNTFNQVDRQDVGITLRITPQINSNDYVSLQLFTEVSSVVDSTKDSELGPTTTVRTSQTTVITRDGQMVIIGGLISDNQSETNSGIPYLKDIPVLGAAFKSRSSAVKKTNLLIFITPRVIKDQFDARDITKNKSDDLKRDIDKFGGYPDRRDVLDNMDMDRVIEAELYTGKKPGTIRPSTIKQSGSEDALLELNADVKPIQNSVSKQNVSSKVVEDQPTTKVIPTNNKLKNNSINPELPKFEAEFDDELLDLEIAPQLPRSETRGNINTKDFPEQVLSGRFIVLQVEGDKVADDLPFKTTKSGLVLINIPTETKTKINEFFEVGQTYSFSGSKLPLKLKALGVFNKLSEAQGFYADLKKHSAYALSPHEIFNLGKGPWKLTN